MCSHIFGKHPTSKPLWILSLWYSNTSKLWSTKSTKTVIVESFTSEKKKREKQQIVQARSTIAIQLREKTPKIRMLMTFTRGKIVTKGTNYSGGSDVLCKFGSCATMCLLGVGLSFVCVCVAQCLYCGGMQTDGWDTCTSVDEQSHHCLHHRESGLPRRPVTL